jgi:hypothetical protein
MRKTINKPLKLKTETIRELRSAEVGAVAGGLPNTAAHCSICGITSDCDTRDCPVTV